MVAKLEVNIGNNMLDQEFKDLVLYAKQDMKFKKILIWN